MRTKLAVRNRVPRRVISSLPGAQYRTKAAAQTVPDADWKAKRGARITSSGAASPVTVAHFGIVFGLLETIVLLARRLRSGLCIRAMNWVAGGAIPDQGRPPENLGCVTDSTGISAERP